MVYESVIDSIASLHKKCPYLKVNTTLLVYQLYQKIHYFFFFMFLFCFVWFFLFQEIWRHVKLFCSNWQKKTQREKWRTVRKIDFFDQKQHAETVLLFCFLLFINFFELSKSFMLDINFICTNECNSWNRKLHTK